LVVRLKRSQKCLLHNVFRCGRITETKNCVLEKVVPMLFQPDNSIGRLVGRLAGCLAHKESPGQAQKIGSPYSWLTAAFRANLISLMQLRWTRYYPWRSS